MSLATSTPAAAPPPPPVVLCPSAPAAPGAAVIGVVGGGEGRVMHLGTPLAADEDFLARAARDGPPERRFRFASACVEGRCAQWTGRACGIVERVLDHLGPEATADAAMRLPRCGIRRDCRWFGQRGAAACAACSLVRTDQG